ncbi:MAG TPA: hypothetical protein VGE16_07670 [Albitalea sp.]
MPSLLGCLLLGLAAGALVHAVGWRRRSRGDTLFFTGVAAACGGVLGGVVAAPLLGFANADVAHITLAEAAAASIGGAALPLLARLSRSRRSRPAA